MESLWGASILLGEATPSIEGEDGIGVKVGLRKRISE